MQFIILILSGFFSAMLSFILFPQQLVASSFLQVTGTQLTQTQVDNVYVFIQLASVLAMLSVFHTQFITTIKSTINFFKTQSNKYVKESHAFLLLLIYFALTIFSTLIFTTILQIDNNFQSSRFILIPGIMITITLIILTQYQFKHSKFKKRVDQIHFLDMLTISFFSLLAYIPGVSPIIIVLYALTTRKLIRAEALRFTFMLLVSQYLFTSLSKLIYSVVTSPADIAMLSFIFIGAYVGALIGIVLFNVLYTHRKLHYLIIPLITSGVIYIVYAANLFYNF